MRDAEEQVFEFKSRGVSVTAPHSVVVEALVSHLRAPRPLPVFCNTGTDDIPKLGELWHEEGGIRAAECRAEDGRIYDLIVVTGSDDKPLVLKDRQWGCYGTEIKGADSLRDGLANTKAMAEAGSPLAKEVIAMEVAECQDCSLPALCELNQVFANIGHMFEKEVFWSSTQFSGGSAWGQYFSSGTTDAWDKYNVTRALVVRRVYR